MMTVPSIDDRRSWDCLREFATKLLLLNRPLSPNRSLKRHFIGRLCSDPYAVSILESNVNRVQEKTWLYLLP